MIYDNTDKVIGEFSESLLNRYQIGFETSMRSSDFILDCVHLLYFKCHKINLNRGGSHIHSLNWITVPLNHEKIGKNPERISKIKPFLDKHNWERINYPYEKDDWKKIEKNGLTYFVCSKQEFISCLRFKI